MKKAFSLVELLSTIAIVTILAAVAVPRFSKSRERGEANHAVKVLREILMAQKVHYAKVGDYECVLTSCANATEIETALGIKIRSDAYVFSVTATAAPGDTFTATATKSVGNTLTLDQDGVWGSSGDQVKYQPTA
jgi:prepilin-type N-terminal cleavage/methylation domain-containing protein